MLCLFIDVTQSWCNLAILNGRKIIAKNKIKTNNNLTDIVVEHINNLITKSNLQQDDIQKILLTTGPGSFTGVRVGILVAKTWALIKNAKIYTIDSLHLQIPKNNGLSILDARGNLLYVALYKNNKCVIKPKLMREIEIKKLINKYKDFGVFIQYKSVDIFQNLISHLTDFKLMNNINNLEPLYIKKPL